MLYLGFFSLVELVVLLILVGLWWCWWLWLSNIGDGGIVMLVLVTAAVRVVVEIRTTLFECLFWGGIYGVGSGQGGSDIGWVVMVVLVMVRYWLSSDHDCGDDGCFNGGSMIKSS